jgi:hypothetical protein
MFAAAALILLKETIYFVAQIAELNIALVAI